MMPIFISSSEFVMTHSAQQGLRHRLKFGDFQGGGCVPAHNVEKVANAVKHPIVRSGVNRIFALVL
jgi:hypothetical protein